MGGTSDYVLSGKTPKVAAVEPPLEFFACRPPSPPLLKQRRGRALGMFGGAMLGCQARGEYILTSPLGMLLGRDKWSWDHITKRLKP